MNHLNKVHYLSCSAHNYITNYDTEKELNEIRKSIASYNDINIKREFIRLIEVRFPNRKED